MTEPHLKPNVLFIMADQFRHDALGCVGGWTMTPNLDALARDGCIFEQAYANSVECIPSRLSLATGLYPHQFGVDVNRHCQLSPGSWTWMRALRDGGYTTALVGKTHLHPHAGDIRDRLHLMQAYGLDRVDETVGPRAAATVHSNMSDRWQDADVWDLYRADLADRFTGKPWLAKPTPLPLSLYYDRYVGDSGTAMLSGLPTESPWFCWISFGGPHEPWDAPEPYASRYDPADMPPALPPLDDGPQRAGLLGGAYRSAVNHPPMTSAEIAAMRANYAGNVTLIDDEIGKIIEMLRSRGEYDRTLIVFTSDHGEMNGDYGLIYKSNFLDPAARIPLLIKPMMSAHTERKKLDGLVSLIDLGNTILDYTGINTHVVNEARSLRSIIDGTDDAAVPVLTEFSGHACFISLTHKAEFDASGRICSLTDRVRDPDERIDLVDDITVHAVIADIETRYVTLINQTPFVDGMIDYDC